MGLGILRFATGRLLVDPYSGAEKSHPLRDGSTYSSTATVGEFKTSVSFSSGTGTLIPPIEPCNLAAFVIIGSIVTGSADGLAVGEGIADVGNELLQEARIAVLLGIDVHGQLHTAADYLIHALRVAALQPDDDGVFIHIANEKIRFGKGAHHIPAFKIDAACFRFTAG